MVSSIHPIAIISVFALILMASDDLKDSFYDKLRTAVCKNPTKQCICILGNFNARFIWPHLLAPPAQRDHGVGSMNENGHSLRTVHRIWSMHHQHLLLWQHDKKSVMTPSLLWSLAPAWSSISWCHLTQHIKHTASLHSTGCEMDHTLVCTKICLTKPKKGGRGMLNHKPKIRVSMLNMKDHVLVNQFEKELGHALDASSPTSSSPDSWDSLCDVIYNRVIKAFGFSDKRISDWFKAHTDTIGPALDQKSMARLAYLNKPSTENVDKLKVKCAFMQHITRETQRVFLEDYAAMYKTAMTEVT